MKTAYGTQEPKPEKIRANYVLLFVILAAILVASAGGWLGRKEPAVTITADNYILFLSEPEQYSVSLEEITSVELLHAFEAGDMIREAHGDGFVYGKWVNADYGTYQGLFYERVNTWIVIRTSSQCVVFNYLTDNNTEAFYNGLLQLMAE